MMIDLKNLTIEKAHEDLTTAKYSVRDLVDAYLKVITEKNTELNAYLEIYKDVLDQVKIAEEKFKNGTAELLTGIPFAIIS